MTEEKDYKEVKKKKKVETVKDSKRYYTIIGMADRGGESV